MQDQRDYLQHSFELKPAVPNGINVLSILSFIGSGFQILGGISAYLIIPFSAKSVPETRGLEKTREMKPFSGFLKWSADATLKQYEYRLPILIVTIITALICIYGVLQMRKLKKQGFAIYSSAELALPLFTAVVIDIWSSIFGFVIAILFIILFGVQRKHLTQ
ncbi:MAG TPA: hypothetical protein VK173_10585 [Lacibacter sp.]|nr:hypothetical protein [Lacibacter sp.]